MDSSYGAWAARTRVPLGFALGVLYLIFSQPTPPLLETGAAIASLGVLVRAWAAGHLDKNHSLAVTGPYAYTRNPLYLGSLLLGLGFAVAGGSWTLGAAFMSLFALVYWPVMRGEEVYLRRQFREVYDRYASTVPLLFPTRLTGRGASSCERGFLWLRYKKNREYEAAAGYLAGIIFLALKIALR
jgi:protein-S-isoprenylcysteine O-methyltransferase Ste14